LFSGEGAEVVAVDCDEIRLKRVVAEVNAAGGRSHELVADLTRPDEVRRSMREGASVLRGLDVFWGNAGIYGPHEFEGFDWSEYERTLSLNLTAAVLACEEAVPLMRANKSGSVVLTSSTAGLVGSIQSAIYSASKFGVVGLVKSLAVRYAPENIRFNAVCPGPVKTPLVAAATAISTGGRDLGERILASIPMARLGQPNEIAEAALWLSSDASSFVTGVGLPIDGGLTAR
jgi:NAD(P)-dependent dehydrogenase (short-subunit alcohol dehydrogenase family)